MYLYFETFSLFAILFFSETPQASGEFALKKRLVDCVRSFASAKALRTLLVHAEPLTGSACSEFLSEFCKIKKGSITGILPLFIGDEGN